MTEASMSASPAIEPALDVTIVIPVRTPDAAVAEVVAALGSELDRLGKSWECVPVFDGVRGAAWDEAQRLAAEQGGRVRPIAFQQPFGESACLAAGLERARGRVVVTSPQYVQVAPEEIERLLAAVAAGADFAAPWRHPRVDPITNRVQSWAFNLVMRRILGAPIHDLNCYFRAIRREVLEGLAIYGDMYRFLPLIAFKQGYRVEEVKVRHLKEWRGRGVFGVRVYVRRMLDLLGVVFLTRFTLKPLRFFGTLGVAFSLIGALLVLALIVQKIFNPDAGVYGRPLFQIGLMLFVLGVQVIGFGLVGEIIIYTQARNLREYRIERVYEK